MFNVIKTYNETECSFHKIGSITSNFFEIKVYVWSYVDKLSEENGEEFINETEFVFQTSDIDKNNLIPSLVAKINL